MFEITIWEIVNFFVGMLTGMVAFAGIYVYFLVRGKNIDIADIKRPTVNVDEEELKIIITNKQRLFKKKHKIGNQSIAKLTFEMCYELIEEIAVYFFPESKYPMLELSVNELLNLNHYVTNRLDDILEKPILKNTKNLRITKIVQLLDKKKAIDENKIVKAAKKLRVGKVLKYASAAINVVNPVYWFRKLVINTSVDVMTKKVSVVVIGIVGEETTKVYSKKLFDKPVELNLVEKEMLSILNGDLGETDEEY